ncbi:MAG: polysaccharide deacetylase family protein [Solirubrobacteraceae bacterium]
MRSRSALALLAVTATLLLASLAVAALGGHPDASAAHLGSSPPAGTTPVPPPPAGSPPAAAGGLYRIVGCRSSGTVAHPSGPSLREVAVGFDDGPWPDTGAFVRMLERSDARATFFMIGRQVGPQYRATLLRELRDGDVLGDHTYTHPDLELLGRAAVREQLQQTIGVIRAQTGYTPCVFRPPYGDYDTTVLQTARSVGLSTVLWNVDPADYTLPGTAAIEQRVLAQVRPGSIIISHDGGGPRGQTLAAYPAIFKALRARGYKIVTINEMLGYRPIYQPCLKLCDGLGITRSQLPRNAIVTPSP